jgi:hypothetical protein
MDDNYVEFALTGTRCADNGWGVEGVVGRRDPLINIAELHCYDPSTCEVRTWWRPIKNLFEVKEARDG